MVVGAAAIVAPILHSVTDAMEWYQHGFSHAQLWLNYVAFLPMPWLLLGMYAVHDEQLGRSALVGALLYGIAFTYFAHTTLYALASQAPTYEALWQQLGSTYTVHGAFMVVGGLLFAVAALRAGELAQARGPAVRHGPARQPAARPGAGAGHSANRGHGRAQRRSRRHGLRHHQGVRMSAYELAQLNVAIMKEPLDSPGMADFVANLDRINALAEASHGFVWRLQTEEGDATAIRPMGEDTLINVSVWRDIDSLNKYVYGSAHVDIMRRRKEWFERMREVHIVLWWVEQGPSPNRVGGDRQAGAASREGAVRRCVHVPQCFPAARRTAAGRIVRLSRRVSGHLTLQSKGRCPASPPRDARRGR